MPPDKNSLSIRLTEPVIPVCGTPQHASRYHDDDTRPPPAVVRGLLTFELAKPTKVSSIELKLQAKAITHYVHGSGPTRIDVTEQYKVHSGSAVVFKAGPVRQVRQRARVQFLDSRTESGANGTYLNGVDSAQSASLDSQSLRDRQPHRSDDLELDNSGNLGQDQTSLDPAPPYTSSAGHNSFREADFAADTSQSVSSSSRIAGLQSSPVLSQSCLTPDILRDPSVSSEHSLRAPALPRDQTPEDDNESFDSSVLGFAYYGLSRITTTSSSRGPEHDRRGRSRSRFSFGKVVHAFEAVTDRMRSRSPQTESRPRSDSEQGERGRSPMKGKFKAQVNTDSTGRALPQIGGTESSVVDGTNGEGADGWVMFPEGTYTYPIFFTIPSDSPPTIKTDRGSLVWKVKVRVKRPNPFKLKMTAQKEVTVICVPRADESQEAERIDLQREWLGQFQYRVQIPGHGVPIGGKLPFQLTIVPLTNIKVHCIMIYLDERTEYCTRAGSRVWSDAIRRATLLVIRHDNSNQRYSEPILPLGSDEPEAFRKSPLHRLLGPGEDESEVASSLIGSGPWTIRHQLAVPDSCSSLHPSNRTKGSNVMVNHTLKIVLRVEKEEETVTTGKKKLYDIAIHAPIQILSCRCTSEWTSLPRYDEMPRSEDESPEDISVCPCRTRHQANTRADSYVSDAPQDCITSFPRANTSASDSLASRIRLHEQLMSSLVSETGDAPPSYEHFEVVY